MSKKICIITGANSGIGKATATNLAKLGFHIVMICRNKERGEMARKEIVEDSENNDVDLLIADFSSLQSVKSVSEEIISKYNKIDVLINNAGVFSMERQESVDGYELGFAVNYLAHYLLTIKLLDPLKKSAPSRIINVSSKIHFYFGLRKNDLMLEKKYKGQIAYGNNKAALVFFTYELARRLEGTGVTVNALHPGEARTKMTTEGLPKYFTWITSKLPIYKTAQDASKSSTYAATSPDLEGVTGKFINDCKITKSGKKTYDLETQKWLWNKSHELIKDFI
jgi:NAD(P)-dependent dehydrogenase (short-subunit alcohol dehydrogenase family)